MSAGFKSLALAAGCDTRFSGVCDRPDGCAESECCCGREGAVRAGELDEQAAAECGDGECRVGRAVLGGEDPAADLVGRVSLNEGHAGDIAESATGAGERHAGEADRQDRGCAGEDQSGSAGGKCGGEDAGRS
jgi:hypothetical protein